MAVSINLYSCFLRSPHTPKVPALVKHIAAPEKGQAMLALPTPCQVQSCTSLKSVNSRKGCGCKPKGKDNEMAYFSQERKAEKLPKIKAVLSKWGMKGSVSVRHHATVVVTLRSGKLPFDSADRSINEYHYEKHYEGDQRSFLKELFQVLFEGNHNNSDPMTDYFDVGWYVDVRIGTYDKPYQVTA